jgi:hypothetical protein
VSVAAVAFVPSAPLLIPDVAAGSADRDVELRAATLDVVSRALGTEDAESTVAVVVAATVTGGEWDATTRWSFSGFGIDGGVATKAPTLPWQLGVGAWLLDECGWSGPRHYVGLADPEGSVDLLERSVVIAVGDGSACRTERAPGHLDPRADGFDAAIADCLARGDVARLAAIDQDLATELLCRSAPVWQWLSAATAGQSVVSAQLAMHVAPYGVGYFAALWSFG